MAETAGQVRTVFGRRTVEEYLRNESAENLVRLFLAKSNTGDINAVLEKAGRDQGVPVQYLDDAEFRSRSASFPHNQGVLLQVRKRTESADSLESHLSEIERNNQKHDCILCLDHLEDPNNLGSILRTCAFFGVKIVVIPKDRSVTVTPAVEKVAAGALTRVKVVETVNLVRTIEQLKEKGYWVVGSSLSEKSRPAKGFDWPEKTVLVTGNEHKGLSRLVEEKCDFLVKIAGQGGLQSLNAAVATAILLDRLTNK